MTSQPRSRHYLEIDPGVELYYQEQGTGTPIVFSPGWTFTSDIFQNQFDHFAQTHRVIALDPRGQGRSSKTLHGNNYTTHGADLAKLITALDLQDVILVGWSTGSLTNLSYVQQAGTEALKGVIGIDMSPKPLSISAEDWVEGPLDEIGGAYRTLLQSSQGQRDFVTWYANEVMVQRDLSEDELDWIVAQSLSTPPYIASALFADAVFADYRAEAQRLNDTLPTLYVIAEHWADTAVLFMQGHYPNIKTVVLGGHMMFWEHSGQFNKIVSDFIGSL